MERDRNDLGNVVTIKKEHIEVYGYKGTDNKFRAVKQREDDYSGIYNLIDSEGVIITGVLEEDLEKCNETME